MLHKILITGTTSGLGFALMEKYVALGWSVIAVNRRKIADFEARFPNVLFLQVDINDEKLVTALCHELDQKNLRPDVLVLNAGINHMDNDLQLEMVKFREVLNTNLYGVLSFIQAAQVLDWDTKIVGISSTSTIVPNCKNLGYLVSKLSINNIFKLLSMVDKNRCYKIVILGPTNTNLNHALPPQHGLQKKIFDFLSLSSAEAATRLVNFIDSNARVSYPTHLTRIFYSFLKVLLIIKPGFYYKPYNQRGK